MNDSKFCLKLNQNRQKEAKAGVGTAMGKDGKVLMNLEFYEEKAFAKTCFISSKMEAYIQKRIQVSYASILLDFLFFCGNCLRFKI